MFERVQPNLKTCMMLILSFFNANAIKCLHCNISDKLKRSALTHAVMNGNTHIASLLLSLGANPDRCDSSGNSVAHYAAAYGWICCLKLLHEAGANLVGVSDWQVGACCSRSLLL